MQVSVGLRRETGVYRHPFVLPAGGDVLLDQGMNEVPGFRRFFSGRLLRLLSHLLTPLTILNTMQDAAFIGISGHYYIPFGGKMQPK